jgi:thiol:disulfide interchange protein DsbD
MGKTIVTVLLLAALPLMLQGQETLPVVRAELIADTKALRPGEWAQVGVLLRIPPGWHIYWTNPGEAGAPTKVQMTWPEKFAGSDVQYPVPVRFEQPGDIVAYGYSESVLLPAAVAVPMDARMGSTAEFATKVSWLCCKDVCVPGKADLTLRLPVASASRPANMELFRTWVERVPVAWNSAESPARSVKASGALPKDGAGRYAVEVEWEVPVQDVEWFPGSNPTISIGDVAVRTEGQRSHIAFAARVLAGQQSAGELLIPSVIGYTDARGQRRGISVPIQRQQEGGGSKASGHSAGP